MQKREYQVFASHLDPDELVLILNESGLEGWELVALAPVTDYYPPHLIARQVTEPVIEPDEVETIPVQTFRYIFKRSLA